MARSGPSEERAHTARMGAPAALGLFRVGAGDTTALLELRALAGDEFTPEVRALMALAEGDSAEARRLLDSPVDKAHEKSEEGTTAAMLLAVYRAPLAASARLSLGDYQGALQALEGFQVERLHTMRFDPRWAMLGQVRLMRGLAYEGLGQMDDAARSYREVMEQWEQADPAIEPYLTAAAEGLERVRGRVNG